MTETATFGGGCFWCTEAVFTEVEGVVGTTVGYAGGNVEEPSYEDVCTGETGHAEVVQVTFDPERVTYEELLDVFFATHDPTTRDRQGPDVGSQYRSVIFTHTAEQRAAAEEKIRELEEDGTYEDIVTGVEELGAFWPAEEEHQDYFAKHPDRAYCRAHIAPKVEKVREAAGNRRHI